MSTYKNNAESFIICLDDDIDFLRSLKISLPSKFGADLNYNMLFMENPVETLDMIRELKEDKEDIALLMTDQMMPHMKGIDFLKEAKKITPDSMRVLLTGHAGMDSAVDAINENLLDKYLTKPINDFDDLVFTMKRLLSEFQLKCTVDNQQRVILDLFQFSNSLNTKQSLEETLEHTISFTRSALDCERISILLLEGGELCIKASIGISKGITERMRIPLGENISSRVLRNRQPMLVENIDEIPWIQNRINSEFKSFMSAPVINAELCSFDVPIGVINVTNRKGNEPFTADNLKMLSHIANIASIAINNQLDRHMLEKSYFDTVSALIMALEARDPHTKGHSVRVMDYSEGIARNLDLDYHTIRLVKDAAILHDIGKIGVRDEVLLKAGHLEPEDVKEIRKHPEISGAIIQSISSLQDVGLIVHQHHEKFDGTGYPDGLKGEEIHIGARIMAVADAFDAMTSNRPYRKALKTETVMRELQDKSGTQFDPTCIDALVQYIDENNSLENEK